MPKTGRPKREEWPACKVEGCTCTTEGGAKGFCPSHYPQFHRGLLDDSGQEARPRRRVVSYGPGARCSVEGCGRRPKGNGLCTMHWLRERKGQDLGAPARQRAKRLEVLQACLVIGCSSRPTSRGMCGTHAEQRRRGMIDMGGNKLRDRLRPGRKYREGPILNGYGYILVVPSEDYPGKLKDGRVLEHRYRMEQMLGRLLHEYEIVHHKNGNRQDNRSENLEIMDGRARVGVGHAPGSMCTEEQALLALEHLRVNDPLAFQRVMSQVEGSSE